MTGLVWDKVDERAYYTGIDRGVLYLESGLGVAWNGLVSITEDFPETATPFYMDGVKYFDSLEANNFAATLQAFTYPREFLPYDGVDSIGEGLTVGEQRPKQFGLCYRTMVGQDHYQIHVVYNLIAVPDVRIHSTISEQGSATMLGWKVKSVPEDVPGYRPTAHAIIDSRYMKPALLTDLENILYGSDEGINLIDGGDLAMDPDAAEDPDTLDGGSSGDSGSGDFDGDSSGLVFDGGETGTDPNALDGGIPSGSGTGEYDGGTSSASIGEIIDGNEFVVPVELEVIDGGAPNFAGLEVLDGGTPFSPSPGSDPQLPTLAALAEYVERWALIYIYDNGDGTWTAIGPNELVKMVAPETFQIEDANAIFVDPDRYQISNTV